MNSPETLLPGRRGFAPPRRQWRARAAILAAALALAGCGGPLSTASSIRVEVEVYKGPLSLELDSQWAELLGLVNELEQSLEHFERTLLTIYYPEKECTNADYKIFKTLPHQTTDRPLTAPSVDLHCFHIHSVRTEIEALQKIRDLFFEKTDYEHKEFRKSIDAAKVNTPQCAQENTTEASCDDQNMQNIREILRNTSELAARMKIKALYWVQAMAVSQPDSYYARVTLATFANLAGQYSNQLASRADALLKQLQGKRRELLPSSVYLRDTSPTDFPNVYAWNRAAAPALLAEMAVHPLSAFSTEETVDRIRMIERLFADHYWTNINTVYASGQGTVRMALIKDDIGNWDLKSFDSDPSELLDAYKDVTLAAMKAAVDAAGGGGGAALDLASQLARGRMGSEGPKAGQFDTSALHARVVARLENLVRNVVERKESLDKESRDLIGEIEGMKKEIVDSDEEIKRLETEIETLDGDIAGLDEATTTAADKKSMEDERDRKKEELRVKRITNGITREWVKQDEIKLGFVEEKRKNFSKAVLSETREIIDNHEAVIDVLQESLNTQSQSP